ncbi:MAG TPA: flagellar motor switch protein FliN [Phycisphaerales bacterium]|nr:flagellar motor switch protein FliN [Phycisphaerales bacterium]
MAEEQPTDPKAMADDALKAAEGAAQTIAEETGTATPKPVELPSFGKNVEPVNGTNGLSLLDDVHLHVKIELGRTRMYVEDVLRLNENSVVELDKAAGDPVDIYVNDRHVARGEVLVLNENFCVRVSEIIQPTVKPDAA